MLLKKRPAKNSKRGIYIADKLLLETAFQQGKHVKYVVNVKERELLILPSEEKTKNTVSIKDGIKPLIDLRDKKALSPFVGCGYLQIEIHDDVIKVIGFEESDGSTEDSSSLEVARKSTGKFYDITQLIQVRKKAEIYIPRSELERAVGDPLSFGQVAFTETYTHSYAGSASQSVQNVLHHLPIPLHVLSLFCGAGILDKAFIDTGFTIMNAVEKDADACKTYRYNIGNHVWEGDIREIEKFPNLPIAIGGAPCFGFTNSNRVTNDLDNPNNLLIREYIRAVQSSGVYVWVLENAPQLLTSWNGHFFEEIKEAFPDYKITAGVLTAADYGTPQVRKRAFVIGSRIGEIPLPEPETPFEQYTTVKEAFEGLHDRIPNQKDITKAKPETLERMSYVPPGGNIKDIPESIRPSGQHSIMYRRLKWEETAPTIVNMRKACISHPEHNRILSVRECARLNDIPDDYIFKGKLASMQQQLANCVPVRLGRAIAKVVKKAVEKFNAGNRLCPVGI
ncbi:DNA cytosine methyltransferase [Aneurinibacillus tyrosinisolvens]|uniref:DNA cytosine methyltransferase n=1 Tax=Aneurinibacillus tyrosinisolvens TaxID=1443435 RepID=UPI00063F82AE|nr:DNA cytosine methyltransferase [Aneurinibacillus tyrosinisolvens]